jgi:hypothetical protein
MRDVGIRRERHDLLPWIVCGPHLRFPSRVLVSATNVLGGVQNDIKQAAIKLQSGRRCDGVTDIELRISERVFVIIEVRKGPELPTPYQLGKYANTLRH